MPHFAISAMRKHDETPLKFTDEDAVAIGTITDVVMMEGGMTSGKTSITFKIVVELPEPAGRIIVLTETSADLLNGLLSAVRGAEGYWAANPEGGEDVTQ